MEARLEIDSLLLRAEKWLESSGADSETAELVIDLMGAVEAAQSLVPLVETWKQKQKKTPTPRQKAILDWLYRHPGGQLTTHAAAAMFSVEPENFYRIFHALSDSGFVSFEYGGRKGRHKQGSFITLSPTLAALSREDFDLFLNPPAAHAAK